MGLELSGGWEIYVSFEEVSIPRGGLGTRTYSERLGEVLRSPSHTVGSEQGYLKHLPMSLLYASLHPTRWARNFINILSGEGQMDS